MPTKTNATGLRIGDEAVRASTGKSWKEWYAALDEAGAAKLSHREIVAWLAEKHGVGGWWRQMVAVSYEQARGAARAAREAGRFRDQRQQNGRRHGRASLRRLERCAQEEAVASGRGDHDPQIDRGEVASVRMGRRQERCQRRVLRQGHGEVHGRRAAREAPVGDCRQEDEGLLGLGARHSQGTGRGIGSDAKETGSR